MTDLSSQAPARPLAFERGPQGELQARDLDLAKFLGYERPRNIRKLIKRLLDTGFLNDSGVRSTVEQTSKKGGRPTTEYWLDESSAMFVVARSTTKKAFAMTKKVIAVFLAAKRGQLVQSEQPAPLTDEEKRRRLLNKANAPGLNLAIAEVGHCFSYATLREVAVFRKPVSKCSAIELELITDKMIQVEKALLKSRDKVRRFLDEKRGGSKRLLGAQICYQGGPRINVASRQVACVLLLTRPPLIPLDDPEGDHRMRVGGAGRAFGNEFRLVYLRRDANRKLRIRDRDFVALLGETSLTDLQTAVQALTLQDQLPAHCIYGKFAGSPAMITSEYWLSREGALMAAGNLADGIAMSAIGIILDTFLEAETAPLEQVAEPIDDDSNVFSLTFGYPLEHIEGEPSAVVAVDIAKKEEFQYTVFGNGIYGAFVVITYPMDQPAEVTPIRPLTQCLAPCDDSECTGEPQSTTVIDS